MTYHDVIAKCGVGSGNVTQKDAPGKKNPEYVQVGFPKVLIKRIWNTKTRKQTKA